MIAISAAEGYELWADTWDATPSPIVAVEERTLSPWIEDLPAGRVLDVGCGTGRRCACLNAIGLDASPAMLGVAARKPGLRGRLAVADATSLPIADACCAAAICALTLGHVRDRNTALRELARILQPGGTLLLTDFHPAAAAAGWRRTFRRDGIVYDLENYPHTIEELQAAAPALALQQRLDATIGEPERGLFERAGKPELFERSIRIPVVQLSRWARI